MTFRFSLVAFAIATVGSVLAAVACGGDDCTRADDHYAECAATTTSMSSSSGGEAPAEACAGARACQSQCINQHTCTQITGMAPSYITCLQGCLGK